MATIPIHVVFKEHTFGYVISRSALVVMAIDLEKGGDPCNIDRTIAYSADDIRPAIAQDYKRFGVRWPEMF